MDIPAQYSNPPADYTFLSQYDNNTEVPILKPNFVSPKVVAQVRSMQRLKGANMAPPVYASFNTLTGSYCNKPQDPSSAYQTAACAYVPHTLPYQSTAKIMPMNSLPRVTARLEAQNVTQPKPSWYWDNSL